MCSDGGTGLLRGGHGPDGFTFGVGLSSAASTGLIRDGAGAGIIAWRDPRSRAADVEVCTGVGLSIAGVALVVLDGLTAENATLTGDLLVLIAAFCVGAYTVPDAAARAPHTARGGDLSCVVRNPLPAAHLLPAASEPGVGERGGRALGRSRLLRCLATAFAFAAWQRGISRIGANRVLVYQYLIVVGVTSGIVFFGETLGINKIAGGVVILGVYLARRQ